MEQQSTHSGAGIEGIVTATCHDADLLLSTAARRHELALFYAALATDLVAWRQAHPHREPEDGDAPIVWRVHASFIQHEYCWPEKSAVDWRVVADRVNREVLAQAPVVGNFRLRPGEASRLYALMCEHQNAPLAPYEPVPDAAKW